MSTIKLLNNHTSKVQKQHSNSIQRGFTSMQDSATSTTKDEININDGYLLSLLRLIEEYTLVKIHGIGGVGKNNTDYYYQVWEILWGMCELLDCKFTDQEREEVNDDLQEYLKEIEEIFTGGDGTFMNKRKSMGIRIKLSGVFKKLLHIMEDRNMLTKRPEDVRVAMGAFSD